MADQSQIPARPRRLWRVVLVLSLALNLAVTGVVGGAIFSGRVGEGAPRSFDLGVSPLARALSPAERRDVGRSLRRDRVMRDIDLRGGAAGIVNTVRATPFDADALRAVLQEQAAQIATVQTKAQDAFVEAIANMTPDRRDAFADRLAEELSKERPRRGQRATSSGG